MPIFKERQTASFHCARCARLTDHQRFVENFSSHLPLLFLTCLLWLPVWAVARRFDRSRPFICSVCGDAARLPANEGGLS
jgi:hypothetical protein